MKEIYWMETVVTIVVGVYIVFDLLKLSNMCTSVFLGSYLKANMEMFFTQVYIWPFSSPTVWYLLT